MEPVNLDAVFARFSDTWSPKVLGDINDMQIKAVKLSGEFVWHHHDAEDELFLVHRGQLLMRSRDHETSVNAGEFIIVPHGVEHQPVAVEECEVILLEPRTTVNTECTERADGCGVGAAGEKPKRKRPENVSGLPIIFA